MTADESADEQTTKPVSILSAHGTAPTPTDVAITDA
jgi:hypothetical protein